MSQDIDTQEVSQEQIIAAVKNEWGKVFTLGDREFEIKDLTYFDYVEFVRLAKPIVMTALQGLDMNSENGEIGLQFNPGALDFDNILSICHKELPRLAYLVCRQSAPNITEKEVALLAHRPQRLIEVVLMQILHNNMIQEFGSFFPRLTKMVTALVPEMAKAMAPSEITE